MYRIVCKVTPRHQITGKGNVDFHHICSHVLLCIEKVFNEFAGRLRAAVYQTFQIFLKKNSMELHIAPSSDFPPT